MGGPLSHPSLGQLRWSSIEQENYLYERICYILLFMTLYATYILLKRVHRWRIYAIFILLGAITSVAVILAGIYYTDVRPTLLASVIGVLYPTLTFGFILPYWPPMVQDRRSLTSVLLGLHSIMVLLLCLIIYDILS